MSALDDLAAEEELVENPTLRAAYNLAPLHQNEPLHWDYEVDLVGEKIYDKIIHLCEICELPILVYGRMLPCKHVFCFGCARKCDKTCRRCGLKVQKVEKSALGNVFVCTFGAPKHNPKGCRRTYLSQRDLQSHIGHRHLDKPAPSSKQQAASTSKNNVATVQPAPNQLPLTQQQAQAQQQSQQQQLQSQSFGTAMAGSQGLMSPPMTQQVASTPAQQSTVIPGLGGGISSQASSHVPMSLSPKPRHSMAEMSYPGTQQMGGQVNCAGDVYRPHELDAMGANKLQQQQRLMHQQQQQGVMHNVHLQQQQSTPHLSSGQMGHFQNQQVNMGGIGQDAIQTSAGLPQMSHQPLTMPVSQVGHETFSMQQSNASSSPAAIANMPQSRSNVNLITVPIQDEGQYRPAPFINNSMMNQQQIQGNTQLPPPFNPQTLPPNVGVASRVPPFPQHAMQQPLLATPQRPMNTTVSSQNQMIVSETNQTLPFNHGGNNPPPPQGINFNKAPLTHSNMGVVNFGNQSSGQTMGNFQNVPNNQGGFNQQQPPPQQVNRGDFQNVPNNQGGFNQQQPPPQQVNMGDFQNVPNNQGSFNQQQPHSQQVNMGDFQNVPNNQGGFNQQQPHSQQVNMGDFQNVPNNQGGFNQQQPPHQQVNIGGFNPNMHLNQRPPGMNISGSAGNNTMRPDLAKVVQSINRPSHGNMGPRGNRFTHHQSGRWQGPPRLQHRMRGPDQGQHRQRF